MNNFKFVISLILFILSNFAFSIGSGRYPHICKQRSGVCSERYIGVCGWFNENIRCFAYPCAITSANICEACKNPNVWRVTYGECKYQRYPILTVDSFTSPYYCTDQDRKLRCDIVDIQNPRIVCSYKINCRGRNCMKRTTDCNACSDPNVDFVMNCN